VTLVRERVLEGVLEIREETRLVEELGGLEVSEPTTQVCFGPLGNGEQERERHILADDRGRLEQPLVLGCQAVDPGREDRLDRRRYLDRRGVGRQPVGPPFTDQRLGFRERPHALLEEQRVAFRPINEGALERVQARVGPEQARQEIVRTLRPQRVDAELSVVRLATPTVVVLGPVVGEQQQPGRRQALNEAIE
jgi:hypothetical protein